MIRGKLDESKDLFEKSISIFESLDAHEDLANAYINLSGVYLLKNELVLAESHALKAQEIALEFNLLPSLKEALEVLADALEASSKFQEAYYSSKRLIGISDSLLNSEKSQQITNLEIKYQVTQKEQQIALQQAQLSEEITKNRFNTIIIISLGVFLFLAVSHYITHPK